MSRTLRLNNLFNRWEKDFPGYKNKFKRDGIINESQYLKQDPKVLLIAKEPNDPGQSSGDYREWWQKEVKYSFSIRISEWARGFSHNFPLLNSFQQGDKDRIENISTIAFMNLKKIGGKNKVDYNLLSKTIENEQQYILEEISIIDPDIIIGCIGENIFWEKIFGEKINFIDTGYDIKVAKHNRLKIIDYYHPSYPVPRAMSYTLLKCVVNSEIFNNL